MNATVIDHQLIAKLFRPRQRNAHKGHHGHALLIAGSAQKTGAAIIAATACLRSGAGLLTVRIAMSQGQHIICRLPETMIQDRGKELDLKAFAALGIGPGLGTDDEAISLVTKVISIAKIPLVVDADALNILATEPARLSALPSNTILTPHEGEFDRLFGEHLSRVHRMETAIQVARQYQVVIVLKGPETLIITPLQCFRNICGNAGLAKGGSGDALTGIITALLAQGYGASDAAVLAVYLHGRAADMTLQHQSVESMLITDVINNLGVVFKEIQAFAGL